MITSDQSTGDEKVGPSRDRNGAVEAIGRVCLSLMVGARISAIFTGVAHAAWGGATEHENE